MSKTIGTESGVRSMLKASKYKNLLGWAWAWTMQNIKASYNTTVRKKLYTLCSAEQ